MHAFRTDLIEDLAPGRDATIAGWVARVRDHGQVLFVELRDHTGVVQVVARDEETIETIRRMNVESCVSATGSVVARAPGQESGSSPLGAIELVLSRVELLNGSAPVPFRPGDPDVGEEARLKYRYLDLRGAQAAERIRLRARVTDTFRRTLTETGSIEVETPTLTLSTPEGARDFLVPARLKQGSFYALPQSPQLFKQLLMVSGIDRYHQVARCYRDEDFRADRQPEFSQLDIEMSFVSRDEVIAVSERLMQRIWALIGRELDESFPRMTYTEAMARYGSDKPDLRFGLPLTDFSDLASESGFVPFANAEYVGAAVMPGGASLGRKAIDRWGDWVRQRGASGLFVVTKTDTGFGGPLVNKVSSEVLTQMVSRSTDLESGDALFILAGGRRSTLQALGALRKEIGSVTEQYAPDALSLLWVIDAPLFESTEDAVHGGDQPVGSGSWTAVHHAFSAPITEWRDTFDQHPESAISDTYDLVCNGVEIGGGSIRIHEVEMQLRALRVMGMDEAEARDKFGFLLDALAFGAPPHGGVAFGLDRLVSILADTDTIREVIAFPKSGRGSDPLTGAPAPVSAPQLRELSLASTAKPDSTES